MLCGLRGRRSRKATMKSKSHKSKGAANRTKRSAGSQQRRVRDQQPVTSVKYELEATTGLVPWTATRETFEVYENALKRRRELKLTHYYVSLTEITETRKQMRAASEP